MADARFNFGLGSVLARSVGSGSASTTDANGEKIAAVFMATKTGNLRTVQIVSDSSTIGGGNPVYDVRIESVDASGNPSGTLFGTNTNGSLTISSTSGAIHTVTLTADAAVTAGDLFAVVVNCTAGGATQKTLWLYGWSGHSSMFPYAMNDLSAGSYTRVTTTPSIGVLYDDATPVYGGVGAANDGNAAINTGSASDEVGNLFTFGVSVDIRGIRAACGPSSTTAANFELVLYTGAAAASSAQATLVFDGDSVRDVGLGVIEGYFPTAVTVAANTQIRVAVKPTTANSVLVTGMLYSSSAVRDAYAGLGQKTARADAGTWSETDTTVMGIEPIISGFTAAASGGSITQCSSGRLGVMEC
jgi:hypothetical protein